jgi:spore germination cell wall hydrolase CwlJ-like protein
MERIVRDVPDARVNFVVATMENDGATVTKTSQGGGLWTITGVFPDPAARRARRATRRARRASAPPAAEAPAAAVVPLPEGAGSRSRDVDILARTIWGEARGEGQLGREGIAAVVLNRLKRGQPHRFGATIADVCLQARQFSCWNADDPNLEKLQRVDETDRHFRACIEIAERAVNGTLSDPTSGSDHYHTTSVSPEWSKEKQPAVVIGVHKFYNNIV